MTYVLLLTPTNEAIDDHRFYTATKITSEELANVWEANFTLPIKTLWDIVIYAYGCEENVLTDGILELSKIYNRSGISILAIPNIIMNYVYIIM